MKNINKRLEMLANAVRPGVCVCDIGTDHAYLPIYLISSGKSQHVYACDINKLPLEKARKNIEKAGLQQHITTRLGNGLECIAAEEVSDIIIAGMGGLEIISILCSSNYIKNSKYKLILQPMSSPYHLRKWLITNGFVINKETACFTNNKTYSIIESTYFGKISDVNDAYYYIGELEADHSPDCTEYLLRTAKHLRNISHKANNNSQLDDEHIHILKTLDYIENILKRR